MSVAAGLVQTTRKMKMMEGSSPAWCGPAGMTRKMKARSSPAWCRPVGSTRKTETQVRLPRGVLLFRRRSGQGEAVDVDNEQDGVLMAGSTVPKVKTAGDQSEYMDVKDEDVSWLLHALAWPW